MDIAACLALNRAVQFSGCFALNIAACLAMDFVASLARYIAVQHQLI